MHHSFASALYCPCYFNVRDFSTSSAKIMIHFQKLGTTILAFSFVFANRMVSLQQTIGSSQSQSDNDLEKMILEQKLLNTMQSTFLSLVSSKTRKLEGKYNMLLRETDKFDDIQVEIQNLTTRMDKCQNLESVMEKIINRIDKVEEEVENMTRNMKLDVGTEWTTHNRVNYYFSSDAVQWEQARMNCRKFGAGSHLASIPSRSVNSFLIRNGKNGAYWTGGTDKYTEDRWVWDGDNDRVTYTDWRPGEPNNWSGKSAEHCLLLYTDPRNRKHWNDALCSLYFRYICQRDIDN